MTVSPNDTFLLAANPLPTFSLKVEGASKIIVWQSKDMDTLIALLCSYILKRAKTVSGFSLFLI